MKLQIFSLITLATTMMVVGCTTDDKTTTDKTTSTTTESSSTTDPSTTNDTTGTTNPSTTTDSGTDTGTTTDSGTGSESDSNSESESASESDTGVEVGNCGWSVDAAYYACVDAAPNVVPGSLDPSMEDPAPIACPENWEDFVGQKCEGSQIDGIGCCVVGANINVYCSLDEEVIKEDCPE